MSLQESTKIKHPNATHGMHGTKEYRAWRAMKNRCSNPNVASYKSYGALGIKVCDEWINSFEAFFDHIGFAPSLDFSLDRINVNGNYEPGNVRWADLLTQARNKRNRRFVTYKGATKRLCEWAEQYGIEDATLTHRLEHGWPIEAAFETPLLTEPPSTIHIELNGQSNTIKGWAAELGVSWKTLYSRWRVGKTPDQILKREKSKPGRPPGFTRGK